MKRILLPLLVVFSTSTFAQAPFGIHLQPVTIQGLGGIQSYAFGQADGKWLIVGGRLDGLHRRQPWASFDLAGHNDQLIVVDPINMAVWTAPTTSLPTSIREQLRTTNMNFHQAGNTLYFVGGYGYSSTAGDHITFPNLTAIDLAGLIPAIISGSNITSYFRQVTHQDFAVTGGQLEHIRDTYYLVGGQRFDGRYNPMGHMTFVQTYTNAIRRFRISDNGTQLQVTHLSPWTHATALHRRDYNVVPQILPNGEPGITAFSGVFQVTADIPYLDCVNIDTSGFNVDPTFAQYYNHYHCATLPMYSEGGNEMHSVFFGGIAQYYDSLGILVQDDNVPFVSTIARITRNGQGNMAEYKLPTEMPGLLGAGSEFIPVEGIPMFENGVIKMDSLTADTVLVGYIFGGISSTAPNIFWVNTGNESNASATLFKVYIIKGHLVNIDEVNPQSLGGLKMQVYTGIPGILYVDYWLGHRTDVKLRVHDTAGRLVAEKDIPAREWTRGKNHVEIPVGNSATGATLLITLETRDQKVTQKIVGY